MTSRALPVVVFDAMGVLHDHSDDVADLLVPYVSGRGGTDDPKPVTGAYTERSLGRRQPGEFWRQLGVEEAHSSPGGHQRRRWCSPATLTTSVSYEAAVRASVARSYDMLVVKVRVPVASRAAKLGGRAPG
ncbi:MAG: hypothetical protein ACYCYA_07915 [Actinomycetes bacterium]